MVNQIIHGDCFEVLKSFPDNYFSIKEVNKFVERYSCPVVIKEHPQIRGVYCICSDYDYCTSEKNVFTPLYVGFSEDIYKRMIYHNSKHNLINNDKFVIVFPDEYYLFERWLTMCLIPLYQQKYKKLGKKQLHQWMLKHFNSKLHFICSLLRLKQSISSLNKLCFSPCSKNHFEQSRDLRNLLIKHIN